MNPITLPVIELKPALAGLAKIIGKRTTLPVLSHVRLERTSTGTIELAATDLDAAAIVRLGTLDQGTPTTLLVPFEDLNNVTKSCARGDRLILTATGKQLAIKFPVGGQIIEHRCDTLPLDEFPSIESISGEPVTFDDNGRLALHQALECASTDQTRLILNGAYVDVSKAGAHYVVGSAPTPPRTSPPAASTPAAAAEPNNPPPSPAEQPEKPMPESTGTNGGAARPASTNPQPAAEKSALDCALAQVEVVRGDFRNAIAGLNKLGDLLKQAQRENKASEKEIQSVRQTLRSLQSVRI